MTAFNQLKEEFLGFLKLERNQQILKEETFYFEDLRVLFKTFKETDISNCKSEIEQYLKHEEKFSGYQKLMDQHTGTAFEELLVLIGKMITIFDYRGYNKHQWNPYPDKRVMSRSNFNQDKWLNCFLQYKLEGNKHTHFTERGNLPAKNAIVYILDPVRFLPITSQGHKERLYSFFGVSNDGQLIDLFAQLFESQDNFENRTVCLMYFLYQEEIKKKWQFSIHALMASDGTNWLEKEVKAAKNSNFLIVWNSKTPTGTADTINQLRNKLEEDHYFYLYYASKGKVNYQAKIVDFVLNEEEYQSADWKQRENVYGIEADFEDYADDKKSAKIVFLAENLEAIEPISIDHFQCYADWKYPVQDNLTPLTKIDIAIKVIKSMTEMPKALNQILYGPPGTGKTHYLQSNYLEKFTVDGLSVTRDDNFKEILKQHPWWKVIAAALLDPNSNTVSSISEHPLVGLKGRGLDLKNIKQIVRQLLQVHTESKCATVNKTRRISPALFTKNDNAIWSFSDDVDQEILDEVKQLSESYYKFKPTNESIAKHFKFITFHQSYAYEDFIVGIKPKLTEIGDKDKESENILSDNLSYERVYGKFYQICQNAIEAAGYRAFSECFLDRPENRKARFAAIKNDPNKQYAIFIDEINRGNVSAIFGELITLIEDDKRIGMDNELWVKLPNSNDDFCVPPNLYIIGTMNTADRSVEALDTALRRRFSFVEMLPQPELLTPSAMFCRLLWKYEKVKWNEEPYKNKEKELFALLGANQNVEKSKVKKWGTMEKEEDQNKSSYFNDSDFTGINLSTLLKTINDRIEALVDRDHTIGHAYFMGVNSLEDLRLTFKDKIIPLLQEYFYGNYEKMELVIGPGFFDQDKKKSTVKFAISNTEYDEVPTRYVLKDLSGPEFDIEAAIREMKLPVAKKQEVVKNEITETATLEVNTAQ